MKINHFSGLSILPVMKKKRPLSKYETDYLDEYDIYRTVLNITIIISYNQGGIKTDGRGIRGMKIFTRQTLTGISLDKLFPIPNHLKTIEEDLWDVTSIAALTRNLIEGYLSLYYFGIEKVSESEAELRFFLLQLHRNIEWYNIRKKDMDTQELKTFEDGISSEKNRIKNHPFYQRLTTEEQNRASRGSEMYKTKTHFEKDLPICEDLREHYRLLSNLVHPLPLSIERMDNERGRGIGSDTDVAYCLNCLMLARKYLAASSVGIINHFPKLEKKFKRQLEIIEPLQFTGFN